MDKHEKVAQIIESSSATFHQAFSGLPEKKRNAVFAIYAYCRTVDDAIDVHHDIERLQTLKKKLKDTFDGKVPQDFIFEALYDAIMAFPTSITPYMELLDAMRDDYYDKPIETEADFDEYCYKAASTVGLMLIPVLASKSYKDNSKKLKAVAIELGKAMQITNILRDVRDDLMNHRVYFPKDIIEKHQIKIETLRTGVVTAEFRSLMEYYIDKAKEKYQVLYENIDLFDKDAVEATYTAAKFYEGILDEIRKNDYNNITKRHYVGKFRKWRLSKKIKKELKDKGLSE